MLMCRVNPKKIRQPKSFKDCWILNPTPDEVRPYRILIKIIEDYPTLGGDFLTISDQPVDYIINLFKSRDESFYQHKKDKKYLRYSMLNEQDLPNDKFAIMIYTANDFYGSINEYLRDKTNLEKNPKWSSMPLEHIKSYVYCLQNSIKINKGVKDGITVYRGIKKFKFSEDRNWL